MPSINWTQTTTHSVLPVTVTAADGTPFPLTGISRIVGKIRPRNIVGSYVELAGTAHVTDGPNGMFDFMFATADVANWGDFFLIFRLIFSDGTESVTFPAIFTIVQAT
jgi:hypothetical protein